MFTYYLCHCGHHGSIKKSWQALNPPEKDAADEPVEPLKGHISMPQVKFLETVSKTLAKISEDMADLKLCVATLEKDNALLWLEINKIKEQMSKPWRR
jgi:hypothetical protein